LLEAEPPRPFQGAAVTNSALLMEIWTPSRGDEHMKYFARNNPLSEVRNLQTRCAQKAKTINGAKA
jgi:hypothetical protein